jgi:PAS domain S-box-containing protein
MSETGNILDLPAPPDGGEIEVVDGISGPDTPPQARTKVVALAPDEMRRRDDAIRDFIEDAPIALHRVAGDGTILWANPAELKLLGRSEAEYVGRKIHDFHEDLEAVEQALERLRAGQAVPEFEARLRASDGGTRHVAIRWSPTFADGAVAYSRGFTRDITSQKLAEATARRSEDRLRTVTDALPVLIFAVDADHRYELASAAFERWFGRPAAQVIGRSIVDVLGPAAYEIMRPYVARAFAGEAVTFETEMPYAVGGPRFVRVTYVPQRTGETVTGFIGLVIDLSERRSFEHFRAAAAARAERLLKITSAIASAVTAADVFEALVDRVAEAVGASSAGLSILDERGETSRLVRARGYSDEALAYMATLKVDTVPSLPMLESFRTGEAIWIPSQAALVAAYPHLAPIVTRERAYRISCLPLKAHDRVLGVLALTIEQEREATEEERDFLLLVASYASQALERLRLFEAEKASRAEASAAAGRLALLNRTSASFGDTGLEFESRLRTVAAELSKALASSINVALIEGDGLLHLTTVHHPDPEAHELLTRLSPTAPLRIGEGMTGTIAATGESVLMPNIDAQEAATRAAAPYRAFLERHPVYAMMGAPLRVRGRIIGTVTAARCSEGQSFTRDDLTLLEELGERAAAAIENARLHKETLDARARAEELYRFAQAVVAADRVEVVFDAALAAIEGALGATRAAVLTFDGEGVMRFKAWRNLSASYRAAVEGHSPWTRDATAPEPLTFADAASAPEMSSFHAIFRQEGIGALAFIPLATGGRLLGKFMVYYDQPHVFASYELETARAIANHLASVTTRFEVVTKLEETVRQNELFAGVLAHDLRNPLGAIMTAAQLALIKQEGTAGTASKVGRPLGRIISSGQRMTAMIDQLLDFTRVRSGGGIELHPRDADLEELCAQTVGELELARPDVRLRRTAVGDQSGVWDPDRLLQVFSNLIGNASQHGDPQAGVSIRLDGSERDYVTFTVHNMGAIPAALVPQLFDAFRGTRHRRDQSRGLGLGLFIVREIVRAHGGTVDVTSSESEGTTLTVRLPRHASSRSSSE